MPKFQKHGDTDQPIKPKVKTKKKAFLEDVKITPQMEKTYKEWFNAKDRKHMLKKMEIKR